MMGKILLLSQGTTENTELKQALEQKHFQVIGNNHSHHSSQQGYFDAQVVVMDMEVSGATLLAAITSTVAMNPQRPIVVLAPYGDSAIAKAVQAGAYDLLTKPTTIERLQHTVQQALKLQNMAHYITWLERNIAGHVDFSHIVGSDAAFTNALAQAKQAAFLKTSAWIYGEPGTGKKLLARAIHGSSNRAGKPFVVVNCRTLSETAAETVLFGQKKQVGQGDFVLGKLQEAEQGTLVLEEIECLPPSLQQKICNAVIPSASQHTPDFLDVRLICIAAEPCHSSLLQLLLKKSMAIELPTLHRRRNDILPLAEHFLAMYSASEQKAISGFTPRAKEWLAHYPWPGNIRQLAHVVWKTMMFCSGDRIDVADLEAVQKTKIHIADIASQKSSVPGPALLDGNGKIKPLKSLEQEAIRFALMHAGGCMTRAARVLGIGRSTLYRKVSELDIAPHMIRANHTTRPMIDISTIEHS